VEERSGLYHRRRRGARLFRDSSVTLPCQTLPVNRLVRSNGDRIQLDGWPELYDRQKSKGFTALNVPARLRADYSTSSMEPLRNLKDFGEAKMHSEPNKRDLVVTRIFDAPVEQVWKAWSDRDLVMRSPRWIPAKAEQPSFACITLEHTRKLCP